MIDWDFAFKIFFISIIGTFFSMGVLTFIIRIIGIIFTYFDNRSGELKE